MNGKISSLIALLAFILCYNPLLGQESRITNEDRLYYQSALRSDLPQTTIQHQLFEGANEDSSLALIHFAFSYDFLTFKRNNQTKADSNAYYSDITIALDIFSVDKEEAQKIEEERLKKEKQNRKKGNRSQEYGYGNVNVEHLKPYKTIVWTDTVYAANADQTTSRLNTLGGFFKAELGEGNYTYRFEIRQNNEQNGRFSRFRTISKSQKNSNILVVKESKKTDAYIIEGDRNKIPFGKSFHLAAIVDADKDLSNLKLELTELNFLPPKDAKLSEFNPDSTTKTVKSILLEDANIVDQLYLTSSYSSTFSTSDTDTQPLSIPNKKFILFTVAGEDLSNNRFTAKLFNKADNILAQGMLESNWKDMPLSLYNIDVAIQNLEFIVKKDQIKQLRKGKTEEKIEKFNAFWKAKDPTPNTEYNELMAEYYSRVDEAFYEFTTPTQIGYKTDMGKAYILLGKPDKKERLFPDDGETIEKWYYPQVIYIFRATTGFGDYQLVQRKRQ